MNKMIERVARAMYNSNPHVGYWAEWEFLASDDPTKETYMRGAQAAIAAMREPTASMLDAAKKAEYARYASPGESMITTNAQMIKLHHESMIDEALR